jgi:hypothetical protein
MARQVQSLECQLDAGDQLGSWRIGAEADLKECRGDLSRLEETSGLLRNQARALRARYDALDRRILE